MTKAFENFPGSHVVALPSNGTDTNLRDVCPNCQHEIGYGAAARRITDGTVIHLADCRKWDW